MRHGVLISVRGPNATATSIATTAQVADRLGYHSVWVSDHVVVPTTFTSQYPYGSGTWTIERRQNFYEAFTTLAYVAGMTRGVRVATSVLVAPQRNPVLMGKMLATLDALSGGRVAVAVGVGWLREEFEALGAGHLFQERGAVIEEWIRIWKALWTEETSSFDGRFYRLPPVRAFPKPAQRPHLPLIIGGNSRRARQRAARFGDGWHPAWPKIEELVAGIAELRNFVQEAKRRPEEVAVSVRLNLRLGEKTGQQGELAGTSDEIRAQVAALEEMGVSELALDFASAGQGPLDSLNLRSIEVFAEVIGLTPRG